MKRILLAVCILAAVVVLIVNGMGSGMKHDFRSADWGMSRAEVQAAEGALFEQESENYGDLGWTGGYLWGQTIYGFNASEVNYLFNSSDGLCAVLCVVGNRYADRDSYISDYNKLKTLLTKAYGSPIIDTANEVWEDEQYQGESIRDILSNNIDGVFVSFTKWRTERSEIGLMISGAEDEIDSIVTVIMLDSLTHLKDPIPEYVLDEPGAGEGEGMSGS